MSDSSQVLDIFQQGDKLAWKWSNSGSEMRSEVEGVVEKFSGSSLELVGKYTMHTRMDRLGTEVKISLTVNGNQMQGTGISTAVNQAFNLSFTKK